MVRFVFPNVLVDHAHHLLAKRVPDLLVFHERVDQTVVCFNAANEIEIGLVVEGASSAIR